MSGINKSRLLRAYGLLMSGGFTHAEACRMLKIECLEEEEKTYTVPVRKTYLRALPQKTGNVSKPAQKKASLCVSEFGARRTIKQRIVAFLSAKETSFSATELWESLNQGKGI